MPSRVIHRGGSVSRGGMSLETNAENSSESRLEASGGGQRDGDGGDEGESDAEDEQLMRLLFGKHCRPCTATSLPNRMLPTYLSDNNRL